MLRILTIVAVCLSLTLITRFAEVFPDRVMERTTILIVWFVGAIVSVFVLTRLNAQ